MKKILAFLAALTVVCSALTAPVFADESSSAVSQASSDSAAASGGSSSSALADRESVSADNEGADSASLYTPPDEDLLQSRGIFMLNIDSGERVYERNSQDKIHPASLTKIMTAIVALESGHDLKAETTDLKVYIQNYIYNQQAGGGGIYQGDQYVLYDLLNAMLIQSVNEASMMIADYIGNGSIEDFVAMMNQKAKEIGAMNTHFGNPSGLYVESEESYTTAYDMALIAQYAMQNNDFAEIVSRTAYTSQPTTRYPEVITWTTTNKMMIPNQWEGYYYEGIKGIKTGSLPDQDVINFVSTATRDGYTYLLVCLGAPYRSPDTQEIYQYNLAFKDTERLYNWAFDTFSVKTLMKRGTKVAGVNVRMSWDEDYVDLLADESFARLVPKNATEDDIEPRVEIYNAVEKPIRGQKGKTEQFIDAPIEKGQEVGVVHLYFQGEEIGKVPLVASKTIERSQALYYIEQIKSFFNTFIFKFVLTLVIILIVLYTALMIVRNHNRRRYQNRRRRPPQQRPRPRK